MGTDYLKFDKFNCISFLSIVILAVCTEFDPEQSIELIRYAWSGPLNPAIPPGVKS